MVVTLQEQLLIQIVHRVIQTVLSLLHHHNGMILLAVSVIQGGNVGIGTTTPGGVFEVSLDGFNSGLLVDQNNLRVVMGTYASDNFVSTNANTGITELAAANQINFYSTTNWFTGNVGIGKDTPEYSLDVHTLTNPLYDNSNSGESWFHFGGYGTDPQYGHNGGYLGFHLDDGEFGGNIIDFLADPEEGVHLSNNTMGIIQSLDHGL